MARFIDQDGNDLVVETGDNLVDQDAQPIVTAAGSAVGGGVATGTAIVLSPAGGIADGGGTATGTATVLGERFAVADAPLGGLDATTRQVGPKRQQSGGTAKKKKPPRKKKRQPRHLIALANARLGELDSQAHGNLEHYATARSTLPKLSPNAGAQIEHRAAAHIDTDALLVRAHGDITFDIRDDEDELVLLGL